MKKLLRGTSFLLVLLMLTALISCGAPQIEDTTPAETTPSTVTPADEYTLPLEDGYNQLTLYWTYDGSYENCDIWIWWGDKVGQGYLFHECEYGAKVVVHS